MRTNYTEKEILLYDKLLKLKYFNNERYPEHRVLYNNKFKELLHNNYMIEYDIIEYEQYKFQKEIKAESEKAAGKIKINGVSFPNTLELKKFMYKIGLINTIKFFLGFKKYTSKNTCNDTYIFKGHRFDSKEHFKEYIAELKHNNKNKIIFNFLTKGVKP